ncbi:50S ribosomal protein L2 [Patescibacteria group bacterium]
MTLRKTKPVTPGTRNRIDIVSEVTKSKPEKKLTSILPKHSGRNVSGKITTRHQGGRQKRYWREIDFKRSKKNIEGRVVAIEYDPNRSANIALLHYPDGDKRYILAPKDIKVGAMLNCGEKVSQKVGNCLPLKKIRIGTFIHNIELRPGSGGVIVRGAGTSAIIQAKEDKMAIIKLPSGETRKIRIDCYATIGAVGNIHKKNIKLGKAGRKRLMGVRPSVRGVAMHPGAHPHGGGEGRSGIGMPSPKSPWGKKTLGKKTRKKKKYSDKYIVKDRRK